MRAVISPDARVEGLYLCLVADPEALNRPMVPQDQVMALEGLGLTTTEGETDRYCLRQEGDVLKHVGFYQTKDGIVRNVSLIAVEAIEAANADRELIDPGFETTTASITRRNIVTRGVSLNELVGVRFRFITNDDVVEMIGTELCHPCHRPSELSGNTGFQRFFRMRGGLRATLLSSGFIALGSKIELA